MRAPWTAVDVAPVVAAPGVSWAVELTEQAALTALRRWYPCASIWFGTSTGRWWALLPGLDRLLEARTASDLGRVLAGMLSGVRARPDGRWSL